ncbi:hypothetical protein DRI96_04275 [Candidatus Aerophobetes bacterium]|uniref:Uncharacterized protein n=1 Tax=Aerophobetes bacterium TaxID=2030807 RepID=A0A662DEM6_UNCAE|nr:MAG: hypothetical protein DRI96_04275 [Candidatus Aerophobetes bacterium]
MGGCVKVLNSQASRATTTVILIMKMDQGWTVPSIIGVEIRRKMRQDSIIMFNVRGSMFDVLCSTLKPLKVFSFYVLRSKLKIYLSFEILR